MNKPLLLCTRPVDDIECQSASPNQRSVNSAVYPDHFNIQDEIESNLIELKRYNKKVK